jgi:rhodanese-related sulfurtransferase
MGEAGRIENATPEDLARWFSSGERVAVLDVREPHERAFCAIAVPAPSVDLHIPMGRLADGLDRVRSAAGGARLLVYCHHGVRSMAAAAWLSLQGVERVVNLEGGIDLWSVQVDPSVPRYF